MSLAPKKIASRRKRAATVVAAFLAISVFACSHTASQVDSSSAPVPSPSPLVVTRESPPQRDSDEATEWTKVELVNGLGSFKSPRALSVLNQSGTTFYTSADEVYTVAVTVNLYEMEPETTLTGLKEGILNAAQGKETSSASITVQGHPGVRFGLDSKVGKTRHLEAMALLIDRTILLQMMVADSGDYQDFFDSLKLTRAPEDAQEAQDKVPTE